MPGSPGRQPAWVELRRAFSALPGCRLHEERFPTWRPDQMHGDISFGGVVMAARPLVGAEPAEGSISGPLQRGGRARAGAVLVLAAGGFRHRVPLIRQAIADQAAAVLITGPAEGGGLALPPGERAGIPVLSLGAESARLLPAAGTVVQVRAGWSVAAAEGCNLILDLPGPPDGPLVAAGAHADAWGPGALDDASGVLLLRRLAARALQRPRRHRHRFIVWDAEELGMGGAESHLAGCTERYRSYLDLDQPAPARGRHLACFALSLRSLAWAAPWRALAAGYLPLSLDLIYDVLGTRLPCDGDPFHRRGVAVAALLCPDNRTHGRLDRPSLLDPRHLARAERLADACLRAADGLYGSAPGRASRRG